jgi:multidrug efflux pump subunit AcrA (membrane-fusion protein)
MLAWTLLSPLDLPFETRGIVQPDGETIQVIAEIDGQIARVFAREGDMVHAGDTLVQLDTRTADLRQHRLLTRIHEAEVGVQQHGDEHLHAELRLLYQQLHEIEIQRARLSIVSPADGVINSIADLNPGELLEPGSRIATIRIKERSSPD